MLSTLTYVHLAAETTSPRLITLHGFNQTAGDLKEYAATAAPNSYRLGLQSAKGVYSGRLLEGYSWFVGPMEAPSPAFFGDSLSEIEKFLWDEIERQSRDNAELPFLLGVEQGAIMALATAAAVPDLISGVIAIDGTFPHVPGWQPPLAPLEGLPVLLIDRAMTDTMGNRVWPGKRVAEVFRGWNADVIYYQSEQRIPGTLLRDWLAGQTIRFRARPFVGNIGVASLVRTDILPGKVGPA